MDIPGAAWVVPSIAIASLGKGNDSNATGPTSGSPPHLANHVTAFTTDYNTIRPHQTLDQKRPLAAYLDDRTPQPNPPKTEQEG